MTQGATLTGRLPAQLANQISEAIERALRCGSKPDEACCVAVQVVADYWRVTYGNAALETLTQVILMRGQTPLPPGGLGGLAASALSTDTHQLTRQ